MKLLWTHRFADRDATAGQSALSGCRIICESRPPGAFAETITHLTGINLASGRQEWERPCPALGSIQAVAADEDLLVVAHSGPKPSLRGYDPGTGEMLWSMGLAAEPRGVLLGSQLVTVAVGSSIVTCSREGRPVGRASRRGLEFATLAVTPAGDLVTLSGRGRDNIVCLAGNTLEVRWSQRIQGEGWTYRTPVLLEGDAVLFHAASGWMQAHDVNSGALLWRRKKEAGRTGVLLAGPPGSAVLGTSGLSRVALADGSPLWRIDGVAAATACGVERVWVARYGAAPYRYDPDVRIELRWKQVDSHTGQVVDASTPVSADRHWVAGDMSTRTFASDGSTLVSGLIPRCPFMLGDLTRGQSGGELRCLRHSHQERAHPSPPRPQVEADSAGRPSVDGASMIDLRHDDDPSAIVGLCPGRVHIGKRHLPDRVLSMPAWISPAKAAISSR